MRRAELASRSGERPSMRIPLHELEECDLGGKVLRVRLLTSGKRCIDAFSEAMDGHSVCPVLYHYDNPIWIQRSYKWLISLLLCSHSLVDTA